MPAIYVKNGGSFTAVNQPYVKNGGSWSPVLNVWVKTGGTWTLTWTGFTTDLSPTTLGGFGTGHSVTTTDPCVVTVTGGAGPFTYAWTYVSGDTSIFALTSTASSSYFRATGMADSEVRTAVFNCVVTDTATGLSETTAQNVEITLTRTF